MKKISALVLLLFLVATTGAGVDSDRVQQGLDEFRTAFQSIGQTASGEVGAEVEDLKSTLTRLEQTAPRLISALQSIESEQKTLDMLSRQIDSRQRQIDFDQKNLDNEYGDCNRRIRANDAEWERRNADTRVHNAKAPCRYPDGHPEACDWWLQEVHSLSEWAEQLQAKSDKFEAEMARLNERRADLQKRRNILANDIAAQIVRTNGLQIQYVAAQRESVRFLGECASGKSRALALKQIANTPGRQIEYESQSKIAEKVVGDIFKGLAGDAALRGLESEGIKKLELEALKRIGFKPLTSALAKLGLTGSPVGMVFTVADTFADIAIAGIDHRNSEVEKNIFLIGAYGKAMKAIIKNNGASPTDPEYVAMRDEIERLKADMPQGNAEVIVQGLHSSAAFGAVLIIAASKYASHVVEPYAGKIPNHLNNEQRQTLGPGGVKRFRAAFEVLAGTGVKELSKTTADEAQKALRDVGEERSRR